MGRSHLSAVVASCLAALAVAACGGRTAVGDGDLAAYEAALRANRTPANPADVRFFTGMIPHHAQAVLFSGWAESHGASRAIRTLCERIVVAQRDEIRTMQTWLADHGQPVPELDRVTWRVTTPGMEHSMHMPGMLTDQQLARLDAARGEDFDRRFLTYMIDHHAGALVMVDELFASYGGAQDDFVYKLASDIYADQSTEIDFMQKMLDAMPSGVRMP